MPLALEAPARADQRPGAIPGTAWHAHALGLVAALATLGGCRGDPLGKPCAEDDDCGPGFDCYLSLCVQVCTRDDECRAGETCYRYHCILPGHEPGQRPTAPVAAAPAAPPPSVTRPPPIPDLTAAELRALRREIELLRQEQARMAELLQQLQRTGGAAPPRAEKRAPAAVVPTP